MEKTDSIQNVILDAGPIIHLEEIDGLYLLTDFQRLIITDAVWREVEYHRPSVFKLVIANTLPLFFQKLNCYNIFIWKIFVGGAGGFLCQVLPCPDRHLFVMFMSVVQVRQMFM